MQQKGRSGTGVPDRLGRNIGQNQWKYIFGCNFKQAEI
jgi:hypothetical protein